MINSEEIKKVENAWLKLGLLHFDTGNKKLDIPNNLKDLLYIIITDWNKVYYTRHEIGPITDSPNTNRSTTDLFRLARYYIPDCSLEDVYETLWELNHSMPAIIWMKYCATIHKCTYFTPPRYKDCRHLNATPGHDLYQGISLDGTSTFTYNELYKYFSHEEITKRNLLKQQEKEKQMAKIVKVKTGNFSMRLRSRHPSHDVLRKIPIKLPFRSVLRLGSTTEVDGTVNDGGRILEINSIQGVKNSSDKRKMKDCFTNADVKTAEWYVIDNQGRFIKQNERKETVSRDNLPYPIIAKHRFGSRGTGERKLK